MNQIRELFAGRTNIRGYIVGQLLIVGPILLIIIIVMINKLSTGINIASVDPAIIPDINNIEQIDQAIPDANNLIDPTKLNSTDMTKILEAEIASVSGINAWALYIAGIWLMIGIVPLAALTVRRLHDFGWSGYWGVLTLVPYIGAIASLALVIIKSQKEENKYGPPPEAKVGSIKKLLFGI